MEKVNKYGFGRTEKTEFEIIALGSKGYVYIPKNRSCVKEIAKNRFDLACKEHPDCKVTLLKHKIVVETTLIEERK